MSHPMVGCLPSARLGRLDVRRGRDPPPDVNLLDILTARAATRVAIPTRRLPRAHYTSLWQWTSGDGQLRLVAEHKVRVSGDDYVPVPVAAVWAPTSEHVECSRPLATPSYRMDHMSDAPRTWR
jgi:hypothetical protein